MLMAIGAIAREAVSDAVNSSFDLAALPERAQCRKLSAWRLKATFRVA